MENELPEGWESASLIDITDHVIGGDWGKDVFDPELNEEYEKVICIRGSEFKNWSKEKGATAALRMVKSSSLKVRQLQLGDILLEISGGGPTQPVGRVLLIDKESLLLNPDLPKVCSNFLRLLRLKETVDKIFVHKYLEFFYYSGEVVKYQGGSNNLRNLKFKEYSAIEIPLPPLAEQTRIVAKLDAAFGHLETLKTSLARIPELLKKFRQTVLTQAVTGKLTEEWREENPEISDVKTNFDKLILDRKERYIELCIEAQKEGKKKPRKVYLEEIPELPNGLTTDIPESWAITTIEFLAFVTKLAGFEYTNHIVFKENGEIPVVRAQNVHMGEFIEDNITYIDKSVSDYLERSQLHGREVLMVFIGAGTGNVCLAPSDKRWHLAPNVAKIDVDWIDVKYLNYYLQSPVGFNNTMSFVKATAQPSLSMETIRQIAVQVPPLEEQQEIVKRVEALFAQADALEAQYQSLKARIDKLPQALLAKAFRGELVPQDPADEPASLMLEKIKAATAAVGKKGRKSGQTALAFMEE